MYLLPSGRSTSTHPLRAVKRTLLLLTSLMVFALVAMPTSAQLPCPPGWVPGTHVTTMTICGVTRTVIVDFCAGTPYIVPSKQYIIRKITVVGAPLPPGCQISGYDLRALGRKLIEENPAHYQCDQGVCPYIYPNWSIQYESCWRDYIDSTGAPIYEPCGVSGACVDQWIVCCTAGADDSCNTNDDQFKAYYCGSATLDECGAGSPPGCYAVCVPAGPNEAPSKGDPCFDQWVGCPAPANVNGGGNAPDLGRVQRNNSPGVSETKVQK